MPVFITTWLQQSQPSTTYVLEHAVAFRIYDLDNTGHIERGEIQRFLVALLKDNPAIDLDDAHLNALIDQVCEAAICLHGRRLVVQSGCHQDEQTHQ